MAVPPAVSLLFFCVQKKRSKRKTSDVLALTAGTYSVHAELCDQTCPQGL
jgi:hypothetical protein